MFLSSFLFPTLRTSTDTNISRISLLLLFVEQETGVLRKEALKLLESAEASKAIHEQLAEEAESLLGFLRQLVSSTCHQTKSPCPCCNTLPLSPSHPTVTPSGQHQLMPTNNGNPTTMLMASSPFRKSKTPDRLLDPIPESKSNNSIVNPQFISEKNSTCTHQSQCKRQRKDSSESEVTSSDNESSSIVGSIQKSEYHKS